MHEVPQIAEGQTLFQLPIEWNYVFPAEISFLGHKPKVRQEAGLLTMT